MSRRHEIALTPTEQREFLASALTMTLASVDRRGYPHLVAMWFVVDPDGTVLMTTYAKSQKAMNLQRDPRCTLLVERGTRYDQLQGVMIRGRATLDPDVERTLDVLTRIHAKHGGEQPEGLRDILRAQARKRVAVRVTPERVSSWDHQKLGGVY
jgi:PPOX class probable F420-dependent enzyme